MTETNNRTSPRRILNILEEILIDPDNFTAKKISHKLDIPLPTIYRHIETLCDERYLVAGSSKKYIPGPKIRDIILNSLPYEPNFTLRRSYLRKLTDEIKETVSLSVPIGTKLVYFDRIEFHWPMQLNLEAGDHLPLHASASGKLYLASIKKDEALEIFKNIKTPKSAKNTITELSQFKKELNKINKQGYAFDNEEWFNGMVGLSLPIKNSDNNLCFCLSTHTTKSRKNIDDLKKILPSMLSAASNLKKALFKTQK
ncbi:IclR family transcriptional regulator [Candidatus Pelagibacter sp.]|nr:IclR family transcriptional regulator [Candidatus Pelagibacter sp.]|tara:strand:+ start:281 stop:1048 length:768 start_codon:yes stop_codon:yes gene_type:complete